MSWLSFNQNLVKMLNDNFYLPNSRKLNGRNAKSLCKAFGKDLHNIASIPRKFSNVKISRIQNYQKMGGCPFCFPHGMECTNATLGKLTRSWKKHRPKQWK